MWEDVYKRQSNKSYKLEPYNNANEISFNRFMSAQKMCIRDRSQDNVSASSDFIKLGNRVHTFATQIPTGFEINPPPNSGNHEEKM